MFSLTHRAIRVVDKAGRATLEQADGQIAVESVGLLLLLELADRELRFD